MMLWKEQGAMEYRRLGRTGLEVSAIGLGTEHIERDAGTLDAILGMTVAAGGNYVDLLYIDPDYWAAYGPVLRPYRKDLILAAHWGGGAEYELDYCKRTFENVLREVGNDYVDVAMMTMIDDGARTGAAWREASLAHLRHLQAQGHVGSIGGSAHIPEVARDAVEAGWLDVLMFPVNMVGHEHTAEHALHEACAAHDVGLVAMKVYHGGQLFRAHGLPSGITPAHCLSYTLSLPVATTVPGPRTVAEWGSTLSYLEATEAERAYGPVVAGLAEIMAGECLYCHHCLPCEEGIEIGWMIWLADQAEDGVTEALQGWYDGYAHGASECVACGACVERCPFGVDIVERLAEAARVFEGG
jgi:predicted aldo/keto reductase-like oxidoreductase